MTTISDSPKLTLGQMAMNLYNRISEYMPETMLSLVGVRKVYGLTLQLDALLVTYRSSMTYWDYRGIVEGTITMRYDEKHSELYERKRTMNFNSSNQLEEWTQWLYEYLALLSSCYNVIGLAPPKEGEPIDDDTEILPRGDPSLQPNSTTS